MAQFDSLIILPLVLSILLVLIFHYNLSIKKMIPNFFILKKFRYKKLKSWNFYESNVSTNLTEIQNPSNSVFCKK